MSTRTPAILWLGIAVVAAALVALVAMNLYQALTVEPAAEAEHGLVTHAFDVLNTARQLDVAMQDAERGQRGYLITGNDSYLEPYRRGVQAAPGLMTRLKQLTLDNEEQQRRLPILESAITMKLAELQETIDLRRTRGFDAARAVVETGRGLDTMRTIGDLIAAAIGAENSLLTQRLGSFESDQRNIAFLSEARLAVIVAIIALGCVLVGIAVKLWLRQQRVLETTRAALAQSQKMETLGQLSGGIAHDFNNMLAVIKGGITLLNRRLDTQDPEIWRFMNGIDLLFTDVGLPNGLNGRQLADEALRVKPTLKVLFTTGYARNAIVHHGRLDPGVELIVKPFTQADLAQKLQKVLTA
jgi:CHASE3 domain sensor protein